MESALKGVTSSCWWQNDLMTVVGPNPGRRKPMCLFMAESTLTSGKVSVGQAIEKKQGCWIVFDSQSFPNSFQGPKKNLKSGNAGIFYTRWWTKKTRRRAFLVETVSYANSVLPEPVVHAGSADLEVLQSLCIASPCQNLVWVETGRHVILLMEEIPNNHPGMVKTL